MTLETPEGIDASAPAPTRPRRSRIGIAMVVIGALLIVAAIPIAIVGLGARSEASDERAKATAARHAQPPLEARRHSLDQERVDLELSVQAMPNNVQDLGTAAAELADAQQHFTEVANHAAAVHNTGDIVGAANVFRTDGVSALDALTQKDQAAQQALEDAQATLQELKDREVMETTPIDHTESVEPAPPRPRARAWHVVVLAVGVLLLAGAIGFMTSASSDRDNAKAAHHRATRALDREKAEQHRAEIKLDDQRRQAKNLVSPAEFVVTTAQQLLDVSRQQAAEAHTTQGLGADEGASADDYNASIHRNNDLVDRYNAKIGELRQLLDDLRGAIEA